MLGFAVSELAGRTAVVTGGLSGIGLATVRALAHRGVNVALGSRLCETPIDPSEPVASNISLRDELGQFGVKVHIGRLDVREAGSVDRFILDAENFCGPIDILVNAAGVTAEQPVVGHPDRLWNDIIDTNLTGAFRATRAVLSGMIERRWGRVINIGSTAATCGWKDNPAYCASKAGLLGLTRCVALEGAAHGVTCVMISPTWVHTDLMRRDVAQIVHQEGLGRSVDEAIARIEAQNPQGRMIEAEEIAELAVYLCSDIARGITMENIQVTGGASW